jgi:hypothetical protein
MAGATSGNLGSPPGGASGGDRAEPMDGHRLLCYSGASTQPATPLELSVCLSLSWTMLTSAVTSCCE